MKVPSNHNFPEIPLIVTLSSLHTPAQLREINKQLEWVHPLFEDLGPVDSEWESSEGDKRAQQKTEVIIVSAARNEPFPKFPTGCPRLANHL